MTDTSQASAKPRLITKKRLMTSTIATILGGMLVLALTGALTTGSAHTVPGVAGANVWVSPGGDDHGCRRTAQPEASSHPCLSFGRALAIARPGDRVQVTPGAYPTQTLVGGGATDTGRVTFVCGSAVAGACTVKGDLNLGENDGRQSGNAPSDLSLDGIDVQGGQLRGWYNAGPPPTGFVFANAHLSDTNDAGGAEIRLDSFSNSLIQNVEVGPICCDADGIDMTIPREGAPSPNGITLDSVDVHDIYDSCRLLTAQLPGTPCSGLGFEDASCTDCSHVDGSQWYGGLNSTIKNSTFTAINPGGTVGQGIFLQSANNGLFSNLTITGNTLGATPNNDFSISGPGTSLVSGNVTLTGNHVAGKMLLYNDVFAPGITISVSGNIADIFATTPSNGCSLLLGDGSSYTPVYSGNRFANNQCQGGSHIARGNVIVAPYGSDNAHGCVRHAKPLPMPADPTAVCASFVKAYALARPGDTILVGNGSYGTQQICRNGGFPRCDSKLAARGARPVTFRAETRHGSVIRGQLLLGDPERDGAPPPSNIVVDGIDVDGTVRARGDDAQPMATNVTFTNMHVWDLTSQGGSGGFIWDGGNIRNLTYSNDEVGPLCCTGGSAFTSAVAGRDVNAPANVTITDSSVHDIFDSCRDVSNALTLEYGPCSDQAPRGCAKCRGASASEIDISGGFTNLRLLRNRFSVVVAGGAANWQPILVHCDATLGKTGSIDCAGVDLEGNAVFVGGRGPARGSGISIGATSGAGVAGAIRILYNTVWANGGGRAAGAISIGAPGGDGLADGATVQVVGNIARNWAHTTQASGCVAYLRSGGVMSPTFTGNEFGNAACSSSDHRGIAVFASTTDSGPDLHLQATDQWALNRDPSAANGCPKVDIDRVSGHHRPCAAGAFQSSVPTH